MSCITFHVFANNIQLLLIPRYRCFAAFSSRLASIQALYFYTVFDEQSVHTRDTLQPMARGVKKRHSNRAISLAADRSCWTTPHIRSCIALVRVCTPVFCAVEGHRFSGLEADAQQGVLASRTYSFSHVMREQRMSATRNHSRAQ